MFLADIFFLPPKAFAREELGGGKLFCPLGIYSCATQTMMFLCHVLNNYKLISLRRLGTSLIHVVDLILFLKTT